MRSFLSGKRAIGDWKTADGSLRRESYCSWRRTDGCGARRIRRSRSPGGYHLVRFSKSHGDFVHHWWPELEDAWEAWRTLSATLRPAGSAQAAVPMTWNYRVVHRVRQEALGGREFYGLHEVYYDDQDRPHLVTDSAVCDGGTPWPN